MSKNTAGTATGEGKRLQGGGTGERQQGGGGKGGGDPAGKGEERDTRREATIDWGGGGSPRSRYRNEYPSSCGVCEIIS